MKYLLSSLFLISISLNGQITFNKSIHTNYSESALSVFPINDSSFITFGTSIESSQFFETNLQTNAINKFGDLVWFNSIIDTTYFYYFGLGGNATMTTDSLIAFGSGADFYNQDTRGEMMAGKFNLKGELLWQAFHGTPENDQGFRGTPTSDGGVIVCGATIGTNNGDKQGYLVKFDKDGHFLWEMNYGRDGFDTISNIYELSNGNLIFNLVSVGYADVINDTTAANVLVKIDKNGNIVSEKILNSDVGLGGGGFIKGNNKQFAIIRLEKQNSINGLNPDNYVISKLDSNLNKIWTYHFYTDYFKYPRNATILNNGNIIVCGGHFNNPDHVTDWGWMALLSKDGELIWEREDYVSHPLAQQQILYDVKPTLDGGFIAAGHTFNHQIDGEHSNIWLLKVDSMGNYEGQDTMFAPIDTMIVVTDSTDTMTTDTIIGIINISPQEMTVFPNPTNDLINIKTTLKIEQIIILDLAGKILFQQNNPPKSLSVKHFPTGLYRYFIYTNDKRVRAASFLKQ